MANPYWENEKVDGEVFEDADLEAIEDGFDAVKTAMDLKKDDFTENTAFNKNFGTNAGEVAEGNHTHSGNQPADATLTALAALGSAADRLPYFTGVDTAAETVLSAFGRTLIANATAADARADLDLEPGVDVQAYDADIPTVAASQAEMEAGAVTGLRSMSPLRVAQAIAALSPAGGKVVQIKIATSSPSVNPDHAAFQTVETVTLTNVQSGNDVIVFGLGIYTVTSTTISQRVTNSSNSSKSIGDAVAAHAGEAVLSIGIDTAPGAGSVEYRLRCQESTSGAGKIEHAIMVAIEFTP